jgi:peptidylprolyl isomerase
MRSPAALRGASAAALAAVALLAGCAGEDPGAGPEAVDVSGEFGVLPVVTFEVPLAVREPSVTVVLDADGPALVEGAPVLVDWIGFDGSTGEVIGETYTSAPEVFAFTRESMGDDLYAAVSASGTNDRVLYLEPATGEEGLPASHVVVVDVRPARAQGSAVAPQPGLPGVTLAEDGSPTVTIPGSPPPPDRVEQILIKGSGVQVEPGTELVVQFTAVRWSDGSVESTTWGQGELPQRLDLSTAIPGLALGLLDQTVGSQVLLVVPPAEALGTDTLVFVVDILAVVSGSETDPSASPVPTASVTASPRPTADPTDGPSPSPSSPTTAQ